MSRTADAAVGMMDAAYFVGRKELLDFFNDLLDLNLSKIEQTAPGHVACQLTELIFPGSIPMSKVNWEAKTDYEFIQNYKLLQKAFSKHRVQRYVDVDKLIRAKYQDNLEMCQWLKAFYDQSGVSSSSSREDYDPVAVRLRGKGGKRYQEQFGKKKARGSSSSSNAAAVAAGGGAVGARPRATSNNSSSSSTNNNNNRKATAAATTRTTTRSAQQPSTKPKPPPKATATTTTKPCTTLKESPDGFRHSRPLRERPSEQQIALNAAAVAAAEAEKVALEEKNLELEATVATLEEAVLEVEKERDFYFGKLRNIEVLLQVHQERCGGGDDNDDDENGGGDNHEKLVDDVFKILYATAEDKLHVNEHGELVEVADSLDECLDTI